MFFFGITPVMTPNVNSKNSLPLQSGTYASPGLIALWSGPLNTIPSGWALCDGTQGTPDMTDRFVWSTNGAELPGSLGGSNTHNHSYDTVPYHDHGMTLNALGEHSHTYERPEDFVLVTAVDGTTYRLLEWEAVSYTSQHDFPHNHDSTYTGSDDCTTENSTSLPPYHKLAFIQKMTTSATIPSGIILVWTGAVESIPNGWEYCNGSSGTPDLRSKFLQGTTIDDIGTTGGQETHSHKYNEIPRHMHTSGTSGSGHFHSVNDVGVWTGKSGRDYEFPEIPVEIPIFASGTTSSVSLDHSHTMSSTGVFDCETDTQNHVPPYISVHFMMSTQVNTGFPIGGISFWDDIVSSIPSGWDLCDGTDGTMDLQDQFLRGSSDIEPLGTTGGSVSHQHEYTDVPYHTHTVVPYSGSHSHTYKIITGTRWVSPGATKVSGHTTTTETTNSFDMNHGHDMHTAGVLHPLTDPVDNLPAFRKLFLIQNNEPTISLEWLDPGSGTLYFSHDSTVTFDLNFTTTGPSDMITLWLSNGTDQFESGNIEGQTSVEIPNLSGGITAKLCLWNGGVRILNATRSFTFINNIGPTVQVYSPNGGENVSGVVDINWWYNDPNGDTCYATIEYNVDGGSWVTIATDLTGLSYAWNTTTIENSENILLRITIDDKYGGTAVDISDDTFTINNEDPDPPPDPPPEPTPDNKIPGFNVWVLFSILIGVGLLLSKKVKSNY